MIWFILAIILAVLAFYFHSSADKMENSYKSYSKPIVPTPNKVKTYWESFKESNPLKAKEIETLLELDFSTLSDRDAREKKETLERLSKSMKCPIAQIKDNYLKEIEHYPVRIIPQMIESTNSELSNEMETFHIRECNTASALMVKWLKERQQNAPNDESYWETWKKQNPEKGNALVVLTNLDFDEMDDLDVKQIIESFQRMAEANEITDWNYIKDIFLNKFEDKAIDLCEEEALNLFDTIILQEAEFAHVEYSNTASYYAKQWYKELIQSRQSETLTPEESFRKEYRGKLIKKIGTKGNNKLFCLGYDSPIAREIMYIMYQFLRNGELKAKAETLGLWNNYVQIIIEETERVTKKYCHVFLQECIEYYNFPERPVVTRYRCPSCGSTSFSDDFDFGLRCYECGHIWNAPYGINLYL